MTDHDALLRSVLLTPEDDAPRLVYADWLDEQPESIRCDLCDGRGGFPRFKTCRVCGGRGPNGSGYFCSDCGGSGSSVDDPYLCPVCKGAGRTAAGHADRAALIRSQLAIAAARADCQCGSCVKDRGGGQHHNGPCAAQQVYVGDERAWHTLWRVLPDNEARWLGAPLRTVAQVEAARHRGVAGGCCNRYADMQACDCVERACDTTWERGFVEEIELRAADFMAHAAALFARHPIRRVKLTDRQPADEVDKSRQSLAWYAEVAPAATDCADRLPGPLVVLMSVAGPPADTSVYRVCASSASIRYYYGDRAVAERVAQADLSAACVQYGRTQAHLED